MRRRQRLNEFIRAEISELLRRHVKDPRLGGIVTVMEVSLSADLKQATVFISVMGSEEEKQSTFRGLESASGFLRRELRGRLELRHVPELNFKRDDSIERGTHLLQLIKEVTQEHPPEDTAGG